MFVTLRLRSDKDDLACEVTGYTLEELRASCDYVRSLLDFGSSDPTQSSEEQQESNRIATAYDVQTGACRPSLAASIMYYLLRNGGDATLEVDGSNAAELLSLADLWCLDQIKQHVISSLRKSLCNSFRRPAPGSSAIETVPHVAALAHQALQYGIGDADGGLTRLYEDCTTWMATWAARVWPTRTFAGMQRSIQDDVLAAAKSRVTAETAPSMLAACRQLSGIPSVAWATRIGEMRAELTSYAMTHLWSNFTEVCVHAGTRRDRSECWGALLEELRAHVAENPDPDAAVRLLPRWSLTARSLLFGKAPAKRGVAQGASSPASGAAEEGVSWLGEDEAAQMQELYEHIRSYCVRHMALVARSSSFRALPRTQQQQIMQIAQEGVGAFGIEGQLLAPAGGEGWGPVAAGSGVAGAAPAGAGARTGGATWVIPGFGPSGSSSGAAAMSAQPPSPGASPAAAASPHSQPWVTPRRRDAPKPPTSGGRREGSTAAASTSGAAVGASPRESQRRQVAAAAAAASPASSAAGTSASGRVGSRTVARASAAPGAVVEVSSAAKTPRRRAGTSDASPAPVSGRAGGGGAPASGAKGGMLRRDSAASSGADSLEPVVAQPAGGGEPEFVIQVEAAPANEDSELLTEALTELTTEEGRPGGSIGLCVEAVVVRLVLAVSEVADPPIRVRLVLEPVRDAEAPRELELQGVEEGGDESGNVPLFVVRSVALEVARSENATTPVTMSSTFGLEELHVHTGHADEEQEVDVGPAALPPEVPVEGEVAQEEGPQQVLQTSQPASPDSSLTCYGVGPGADSVSPASAASPSVKIVADGQLAAAPAAVLMDQLEAAAAPTVAHLGEACLEGPQLACGAKLEVLRVFEPLPAHRLPQLATEEELAASPTLPPLATATALASGSTVRGGDGSAGGGLAATVCTTAAAARPGLAGSSAGGSTAAFAVAGLQPEWPASSDMAFLADACSDSHELSGLSTRSAPHDGPADDCGDTISWAPTASAATHSGATTEPRGSEGAEGRDAEGKPPSVGENVRAGTTDAAVTGLPSAGPASNAGPDSPADGDRATGPSAPATLPGSSSGSSSSGFGCGGSCGGSGSAVASGPASAAGSSKLPGPLTVGKSRTAGTSSTGAGASTGTPARSASRSRAGSSGSASTAAAARPARSGPPTEKAAGTLPGRILRPGAANAETASGRAAATASERAAAAAPKQGATSASHRVGPTHGVKAGAQAAPSADLRRGCTSPAAPTPVTFVSTPARPATAAAVRAAHRSAQPQVAPSKALAAAAWAESAQAASPAATTGLARPHGAGGSHSLSASAPRRAASHASATSPAAGGALRASATQLRHSRPASTATHAPVSGPIRPAPRATSTSSAPAPAASAGATVSSTSGMRSCSPVPVRNAGGNASSAANHTRSPSVPVRRPLSSSSSVRSAAATAAATAPGASTATRPSSCGVRASVNIPVLPSAHAAAPSRSQTDRTSPQPRSSAPRASSGRVPRPLSASIPDYVVPEAPSPGAAKAAPPPPASSSAAKTRSAAGTRMSHDGLASRTAGASAAGRQGPAVRLAPRAEKAARIQAAAALEGVSVAGNATNGASSASASKVAVKWR